MTNLIYLNFNVEHGRFLKSLMVQELEKDPKTILSRYWELLDWCHQTIAYPCHANSLIFFAFFPYFFLGLLKIEQNLWYNWIASSIEWVYKFLIRCVLDYSKKGLLCGVVYFNGIYTYQGDEKLKCDGRMDGQTDVKSEIVKNW